MAKTGQVGTRQVSQPSDNEIEAVRRFRLVCTYDFAVDGGAIGDIALVGAASIPSGAMIRDVTLNVLTIPTSGGAATIAVYVESAADCQAAVAYNGAPWSSTGLKAASAAKFGANPFKTTAARDVKATIGGATLTAGKFEVIVELEAPNLGT